MNPRHQDPRADWLLQHAAWLRRLARSLVGDAAAAEDLVQDAWVATLAHGPSLDRPLEPWLGTVLRNFQRRSIRSRHHRRQREERRERGADSPATADLCAQLESERLVTEELARLAEPFRSTLLLRYYRGLEPIEIARQLGMPPGTVRWRIKRGLELMRERLDESCGGGGSSWGLLLLPLARSGGTAASVVGPSVACTGFLVMNALLEVGAALAVVLLAYIGLTLGGILPLPFGEGEGEAQAVEVSWRPLAAPAPIVAEGAPSEAVESRRVAATSPDRGKESPAAAASSGFGAVTAELVDDAGRPLVGAMLRVVDEEGQGPGVRSATGGQVRLELPMTEGERRVQLEALHHGYASHGEDVRFQAGTTVPRGRIVLPPGGAISGCVVDAEGRGVEGAVVSHVEGTHSGAELTIQCYGPADPNSPRLRVPRARSGRHGAFHLGGLTGGYHRLWVESAGMVPAFTTPIELRAGQESFGVEVVLRAIGDHDHVHGIVLDPAGAPVPHAALQLGHRSSKGGLTISGHEDRARADGTFDFLLFDDARMWITAVDPAGRYGAASAEDVPTGAAPLVLQLTDLARTTLEVRGEHGRPLARFGYRVHSPDGELTFLEEDVAEREDGRGEFALPDAPFCVRVQAPLHGLETLGPFLPDDVGETIEVRLTEVRGLSGRVFAGGAPLAGAKLILYPAVGKNEGTTMNGFPCKFDPLQVDETQSAADGRFVLTAHAAGDHWVVAAKDGFAPADLGPLHLDPAVDPAEVELHLGVGGAIAGRVIAARGEDPAGTIVGIHRGDGRPSTMRVGADGTYRFEGLTPGRWIVEVRGEEVFHDRRRITTSPRFAGAFADEAAWNCEVREGETTVFDLRLGDGRSWRLTGRMRVDGRLPHAWIARLLPADGNLLDLQGPGTILNPDGSFKISAPEPGPYLLAIKSTLEEQEEQMFFDRVGLYDEVTPWGLELASGSLVVEDVAPPTEEDGMPSLVYLWEGPGDLLYLSALFPDPEEESVSRLRAVPAGTGKLVRPTMQSMNPRDWEVLGEVSIVAGKETRGIAP